MCKAADENDKAFKAISDVKYSFERAMSYCSEVDRGSEDIEELPEHFAIKIDRIIGNLEEVQKGVRIALEHARAAAESLRTVSVN